jgi:hypothetical protein
MATKKVKLSDLPAADSLEGLFALGTTADNQSVKVSMPLLKGNKGDEGEKGKEGNPGIPGKAPRISDHNTWEVYDNASGTWTDTGIDCSSDYELTKEKMEAAYPGVGGNNPVNEIRYTTEEAGNIFGGEYLRCDGTIVSKLTFPSLKLPQLGIDGLQKFLHSDCIWNACSQLFDNGTSFYAFLTENNATRSSLWSFCVNREGG